MPAAPIPLLTAHALQVTYGTLVVLDGVDVSLHGGEHVGLVGANGTGKSTLARVLAGQLAPDGGEVSCRRDARVCYLSQNPELDPASTPRQQVLAGMAAWTAAHESYEQASARLARGAGDQQQLLEQQEAAAAQMERLGGWDLSHRADEMLGHLGVRDADAPLGALSGGEQRRVALAQVLLAAPDLAILDEPTNHLDLGTVEWLERYLEQSFAGALLLITHDRYVLDRVVQRTLELEQGRLYSYAGGYADYLEGKAERMAHRARTEANRQRFLRRELDWLRRQPKARSTRQKARLQRAHAALSAPGPQRERQIDLQASGPRVGRSILQLKGLQVALGGRTLVRELDFTMLRGQRVGVVGENGCGKTTLLRTVLGELAPTAGQVVLGKNTEVSYLSQTREGLDLERSVLQNVAGKGLTVYVGDEALDAHSYLARFLFVGPVLQQPVGALSGGERTRVALARLLTRPANLILMDEPTNDLDVQTLGALEQLLLDFVGTALVVTHDRYFLDRVATDILAFEPGARVVHYAGNYSIYRSLRAQLAAEEAEAATEDAGAARAAEPAAGEHASSAGGARKGRRPKPRRKGLTYAEELELAAIVPKVEAADAEVSQLEARLADPTLYQQGGAEVPQLLQQLEQARERAGALMARWEELEQRASEP